MNEPLLTPKPDPAPIENPPPPAPAPPPGGTPSPEPPPATEVVLSGTKTEREIALERDLKNRELRIADLEDQNRQLKTIPKPAAKAPPQEKKQWLSGLTFFDEDKPA